MNLSAVPMPFCIFHRQPVTLAMTLLCAALLSGCASDHVLRTPDVSAAMRADLPSGAPKLPAAVPAQVSEALAEPVPPPAKPSKKSAVVIG